MNTVIGAQRRGRFFFVVMATTVIAAVFSGFEPTFYFRGFHAQTRPMSVLLHVHGIVFSVWVVLFLAQTLLIARGNYRWHRRLGWALAGVAAAMIVLVLLAMVEELRRVNGFPPPPLALALSAFDILVFGVLVGSALYLRRLPDWHKRLMISATIVLLGSSIRGQTLNPYDLTRTPGGSSSGTGAGVSANFAVAGIGTDTINSIRSPASANCIVGIRPTLGLVSRTGVIPYSFTQDAAGPLARTVTDAAKMLNVLVGYDPNDPATAWSVGHIEEDYSKFLKADGVKGKRIGVLRIFFGTAAINEEVNSVADRAVEDLRTLGATVIELSTPDLDSGKISSDISVHLYEFKPAINTYLASGQAPVKSLEEIIFSGKFHPNIGDNIKKAQSLEMDDGYRMRLEKRSELQQRVMKLMADDRLDAIVFPHQKAARSAGWRDPSGAQRRSRVSDRISFHCRPWRIFLVNGDGAPWRPGGYRIPRETLVRESTDRDRLRLRASDQASSSSADHSASLAFAYSSAAAIECPKERCHSHNWTEALRAWAEQGSRFAGLKPDTCERQQRGRWRKYRPFSDRRAACGQNRAADFRSASTRSGIRDVR